MDPFLLYMVFAIMWLASFLFAEDIENMRAAELRLARCPDRVR